MSRTSRPQTPDGRYLVSRGVLKRCTNPELSDSFRRVQLKRLMQSRLKNNASAVLKAKIALGEAGPVWWNDGSEDYSGIAPSDTPYANWWAGLSENEQAKGLAVRRASS